MKLPTHAPAALQRLPIHRGRREDDIALVVDAHVAAFPEERVRELDVDIADVDHVREVRVGVVVGGIGGDD